MKLQLTLLAAAALTLLPFQSKAQVSDSIWNKSALGAAPATDDKLFLYDTSATASKTMTIANLFTAPAISAIALSGSGTTSGTLIQSSADAAAFASGPNGNTNPVFRLVNNVSSAATGLSITGRAAAAGTDLTVLSSGTNENLRIDAKGSGYVLLNNTATGALLVGDATTPALSVVHTSEGTGIGITSAAAASGVALAAISSGTDENLTIDAKGSGTITLNGTGTGAIALARAVTAASTITQTSNNSAAFTSGPNGATNPVFKLVNNVSSAATGLSITGRAAGAGVDLTTLSSGTNEALVIEAKGSGTVLVNGTATGAFLVADATNPAFQVVHTSEGTGVKVTSAAAASGVAVAAISSGTNENMTIDAKGSGSLTLNATATGATVIGNQATLSGALVGTPQALSGAGAVSLTTVSTHWTTTGADAGTLADGTAGQIKVIIMKVDGGTGTLTPTTASGFTDIVFDDPGDAVTLEFVASIGWCVIGSRGVTFN